ncbi:MAG: TolC family protein [Bacteroidales bacterium]|nr:TolC family protein [Bacteroidales bacterium]
MKKFVSLTIAFVITISWVNGQNTFHSLEEIWSYALENNSDNTVYQLQVEKAIKDYKTVNSFLYPKISVGMSGQYNKEIPETPVPGEIFGRPGETIYAQFGQTYNYTRGLSASKTLLDWQSMFQAKIAKSNTNLVKAEKALFEQNLKQQLAQVYNAALTAQAAVELSQKDLALADSTLLLTTNRFQQGIIDNLSLNQAKINKNNALDRLEQNKQYLFENETNLKMLLGLTPSDTLFLSEKIQFNENISIETIIPDELNLNLYKIQTENAGFVTKQAIARFSPKLDIVTYWGGVQYHDDFKFSMKSSDWQPNRYIGLNLSIPLFSGFANKNQYQSAKISQNIAQLKYDEAIRKSSLNDSILFNNYVSAKHSVQMVQQNLELANENVQLAYSKYSEGLISLDNYLSVYDDYLAVENQYFSRLADYLINKAIIQSRNK